jgi:hypothetical protein
LSAEALLDLEPSRWRPVLAQNSLEILSMHLGG